MIKTHNGMIMDWESWGAAAPAELEGHDPKCICSECIEAARAKLTPQPKVFRSALDVRSERIRQQLLTESGFNV